MLLWPLGMVVTLCAVRSRMKDDQEAAATKEAAAFAWSEKRLVEVMERFPYSPTPAFIWGQEAQRRGDWEEALRRYQVAIERDPKDPRGHAGAASALRALKRLDESDALLRRAEKRCRGIVELQFEFALNATVRKDWQEAARRWAMHRQFRPDDKLGYEQGQIALRKAGLTEEADALAAEAVARFSEARRGRDCER